MTILQISHLSTNMIHHTRIRMNTRSIIRRKSGVFLHSVQNLMKVVHTLSSVSSSLSTYISVQSFFFYLQLISKTLVPSSPSGTETFFKIQTKINSNSGLGTAVGHPQLLNVYSFVSIWLNNLVVDPGIGLKANHKMLTKRLALTSDNISPSILK